MTHDRVGGRIAGKILVWDISQTHKLKYKPFFYDLFLVLLLALMEALLELAAWGVQTCSSLGGAGRAAVSQT